MFGALPVQSVAAADAGSKISVSVNCTGNPEKVTIKNNTGATIRVTSIGSRYQPRSSEPYAVNVAIGSGNSKTFTAGPAATGPLKLTGQYIFANGNPEEGARVTTSVGTKTRRCPA